MVTIDDMPSEINLSIVTGDYREYSLTYTADGEALDITDWTFSFYAKKSVDDADTDAVIKVDNASFTNNGVLGTASFKVLARDLSGEPLEVQDLFHQLKVVYDSSSYNYPQTHLYGKLSITKTSKEAV